MGGNISTNSQRAPNQKEAIASSLMEMFKPSCMGGDKKKKNKNNKNKYMKIKPGLISPTLEDWLHSSPSPRHAPKDSPYKVCPASPAGSYVFMCCTTPRDSISIDGDLKKRVVSFRLPEEADIHVYCVHEDDDDDDDEYNQSAGKKG